jgi:hypothetical protein
VKRQQLHRVSGRRGVKLIDYAVAEMEFTGASKIRYRAKTDHTAEPGLRGEPKPQMSARRMSERDSAVEIQMILAGNGPQMSGCGCDIIECAGPSATGVADRTEFDVPGSNSLLLERAAKVPHVREIELVSPESAVDRDDDRPQPVRRSWQAQIRKLARV